METEEAEAADGIRISTRQRLLSASEEEGGERESEREREKKNWPLFDLSSYV